MWPAGKVGITRGGYGAGRAIIIAAPVKALQASGRRELTFPVENRSGGCWEGWPSSNCTAAAERAF